MPTQINEVLQQLRWGAIPQNGEGQTDGQLLGRFIEHRDEISIAVLVQRHGPMVWGVCRRVLGNHHDAEDAFQATFLVLLRRARSITPREMVGNWLYGVAYQTALKGRAMRAKKQARERHVSELAEPVVREPEQSYDLALLDQELSCLPGKYRVAIVLCDLEGKTRKEASSQLGIPEGTLAAQLTQGRALLAKRVARRFVALSTGTALGTVLPETSVSAGVPAAVMSSTIRSLALSMSGQAAAEGTIPSNIITLTNGVLKAMIVNKLKRVMALVLVLGVVTLGLVGGIAMAFGDKDKADPNAPPEPPKIPEKGEPQSAVVFIYNNSGEVVRVARFREPTELEALEKCFPNYRERPSSNMAAGWKMGAEVFLNFPQGNTVRVMVAPDQDNGDPILWSVGKGDFRVDGDFYKMLPAGGKAIGTVGDEFGEWSAVMKGLKARLILERGQKLNGTPLLTTYLEFSNVSGSAAPIVISLSDTKYNWVVTDGDGKELRRYTGAVDELPSTPRQLVIPNGSVLRFNASRSSTGVGANKAAHLDLGGENSWTFERNDKKEYFLGGKLVAEKADKDDWSGTLAVPKVRIPLARGDR